MLYCYFFGPSGLRRPRAPFPEVSRALREASLPLMIPIILLGGILTGWFTPTEAGVVAVVWILGVVIPAFARGSTFVQLITRKPGGPFDAVVCPPHTVEYIQSTYDELAKGHDDPAFQAALAFLKKEFRLWEKLTVRELRERYMGAKPKGRGMFAAKAAKVPK